MAVARLATSVASVLAIVGVCCAAIAECGDAAAQSRSSSAQQERVPPLSWTCPMHPEVVEGKRGTCPICRMALEPIRLDTIWSCPVHAVIAETSAGRCRICGRDLAPVTVAVAWQCGTTTRADPGRCADGSAATIKYTPRPHGNHNPQHGGTFFMAPDNWHHLEGTLPRAGVFRVYLYDDYSKPLPADQVAQVAGRVAVGSSDVPLRIGAEGGYLEATVPATPPVALTATLAFEPGTPAHRFDFAFDTYSIEGRGAAEQERAAPLNAQAAVRTDPAATDHTAADRLAAVHANADLIKAAIDRRAYSEIWVPALQAKDAALAIAPPPRIDAATRRRIEWTVGRIVRAAWLLDAVGDLGDARQIADAHATFAAALADLDALLMP